MAGFLPICQSADYALSILLVSDIESQLKNFSTVLNDTGNGEREGSVKVYTCESVSQIVHLKDKPQCDFVALFVNEKRFNAIHEVEQNLLKLDQAFMFDRVCLICDNVQTSGGFMPKILHLKHKYQLHALWGNLEEEFVGVCKRLLNLASAVCGATTGFPLVTHKVWHGRSGSPHEFSTYESTQDRTF
ncbi:uncharacterized protein LOC117651546 [Thrips palmi]|uniref:Uncharacterized protein LOC117651546 n=1 Tax=Thrips palmi TaxID=161013 RepID=A0A6P9A184_THRPL|nr:uncharacterized protein LOC117651546 [Thrips palmi]